MQQPAIKQTHQALQAHYQSIQSMTMRDLFAKESDRFERFSLALDDLLIDYSKNQLTQETLQLLIQLAEQCHLKQAITDLFSGVHVNMSEDRAALHTALRADSHELAKLKDSTIRQEILTTQARLQKIHDDVHSGRLCSAVGRPFRNVLHIGIGGSDLGPAMVHRALLPFTNHLGCHFLANYDVALVNKTLKKLDPADTLVIIVSKSFTSMETLANAHWVREWLLELDAKEEAILKQQVFAVSANTDRARTFGIAEENILPMWDWVGGRFSLWSAVSLSLLLTLGDENFQALRAGARRLDQHFQHQAFKENLPVIFALLDIWYQNYFNAPTRAIIPYRQSLHLLPAFLQQLHMESLGKRVTLTGQPVKNNTGAIIWGGVGTNTQHSFHQLLMQGTQLVPIDFILPLTEKDNHDLANNRALVANCLAQSQTLMRGYQSQEIADDLTKRGVASAMIANLLPHKVIPGNTPSTTIMLRELTPYNVGALIALYEHKVFAKSILWQINAFDQWGVERGKVIAKEIEKALENQEDIADFDSSTKGLMRYFHSVG